MEDSARFARAFKIVIGEEGGYVNHPNDPGGETKYGITKRDHPTLDIRNLTLEHAREIYWNEYWSPLGLARLHDDLAAFIVFDLAVNSGPKSAGVILQRAVNYILPHDSEVGEDGRVGAFTVAAANAIKPDLLVMALCGERYRLYQSLVESDKTTRFEVFAGGWLRRCFAPLIHNQMQDA